MTGLPMGIRTADAMSRRRIGLQAALNGDLTKDAHGAVPLSVEELAHDAVACVAAGARAIHLHPRDAAGRERLDAEVVDAVVGRVREACGVPVGVSTGAWIEPDLARRLALVRAWRAPDYASVNLSEPGRAGGHAGADRGGVGIEAGVWTVEDAERLAASGVGGQVTRILVEPVAVSAADAVGLVDDIHRRAGQARPDGPAPAARRRRGHLGAARRCDSPRARHANRAGRHALRAGRRADDGQHGARPRRPRVGRRHRGAVTRERADGCQDRAPVRRRPSRRAV